MTVPSEQQPKVEPPKPVQLARTVWIAGAVIGAVRSIVQLADRRALTDQLRPSAPQLSQDQLDSLASTGIAIGLVLIAGLVLLNVWFARRMAAGRNWARVLIIVLAGFELVFGVIGLLGIAAGAAGILGVSFSGWEILISVAALAVDAVTLVLLFRRESVAFFAANRTQAPPRPFGPPFT